MQNNEWVLLYFAIALPLLLDAVPFRLITWIVYNLPITAIKLSAIEVYHITKYK